ncbi:High-affinity zinc uptake system ATP-binding protein ZnuC [Candidatus Arsenophonus lipoptenae]|uniref:High-affinity zinc uptake system ATP-binding protein ZnuC n=1 Tax=Candidatus Arsenophonus lipoptenae TaxID=634113 RepID=A0A0X9VRU0_9GAMM|nr:ATP-binding cassette domain-containing protein [Candidatus Arsenophonus lipoptenae]AMA64832.1 High-affinity zinc uptake system ATP-binding protein ZnuC [Candidatus Arsenophonus lipoptenae]
MKKYFFQTTPNLVVDNITVIYSNGYTAIYNSSFNVIGGSICGLLGVNGSGKSTLFKTIMGLVIPTKGNITLNNTTIKIALKANIIAYVPQTEAIDWNFPILVSDVVMMGRYGKMGILRIPSKKDKEIVNNALECVDLLGLKHRQIGELSGGQKKRVFFARALAQEGKVLLLDEPFTGVDIKTESTIIELLLSLRNLGYLILISTHDLSSVPKFCDQVILINRTILASGPIKTTFTSENIQLAFGNCCIESF